MLGSRWAAHNIGPTLVLTPFEIVKLGLRLEYLEILFEVRL